MNSEEPYRDQAERLKRRIEKINDQNEGSDLIPPREQVHRQKKTKTKWKLKYPVIRLLVLFFILLPIIIFSVISYLDGKKINGTEKTNGESVGYEEINFDKPKKEEIKNTAEKVDQQKKTEQETSSQPIEKQETVSTQTQPASNNTSSVQANEANTSSLVTNNSSSEQTKVTAGGTTQPVKTAKIIYHTVKPKETLYRIALLYYHSKNGINKIKKANHILNNQITTGQVLKIPLDN